MQCAFRERAWVTVTGDSCITPVRRLSVSDGFCQTCRPAAASTAGGVLCTEQVAASPRPGASHTWLCRRRRATRRTGRPANRSRHGSRGPTRADRCPRELRDAAASLHRPTERRCRGYSADSSAAQYSMFIAHPSHGRCSYSVQRSMRFSHEQFDF